MNSDDREHFRNGQRACCGNAQRNLLAFDISDRLAAGCRGFDRLALRIYHPELEAAVLKAHGFLFADLGNRVGRREHLDHKFWDAWVPATRGTARPSSERKWSPSCLFSQIPARHF